MSFYFGFCFAHVVLGTVNDHEIIDPDKPEDKFELVSGMVHIAAQFCSTCSDNNIDWLVAQ